MSDTEAVILDTHVWVWAMEDATELRSQPARRAIEQASEHTQLHLCSVSVFELTKLESSGRVSFALALDDWITQALSTPGLVLTQLEQAIAMEAARLPGAFKGDLIDRVIAATARRLGAVVLSADTALLDYGRAGYLKTLDPSL